MYVVESRDRRCQHERCLGGRDCRVHYEPNPQEQADPEAAVRAERGSAEYIPVAELPHPGEQLGEAAVGEGIGEPRVAGGVGHPVGILG
jgi:hypothetical protein